jgi:phosphatidylserine/phosphatidylglycerophosphate/cardiolipin synthase-like enzyme
MSAKEKRLTMETLAAIPDNESLVILATGKYVGEGFDYPRLDTLFLALPISWKGKLAQYAGRLHRNYAGKNEVLIYDYADIHIPVLEKMYQRRLKSYASIGYQTRPEPLPDVKSDVIYDGKSFYHVFQQDISNALHEIIIVSPFMRKNRLSNLKPVFASALTNGIKITVVTRPPEDFSGANEQLTRQNAALLCELGVTVKFKSGFHQKFTVIDTKTVWYGSVNFLSFGTAEESIMRLESADIACALLDTVI